MDQDYIILPGGLHVWNPVSESLGSVPEEIVDKRSSGYTLHRMEDRTGWREMYTGRIFVFGDIPDQALRTTSVTAEKLNEMLGKELGGPEQYKPYKIRIFSKREDFCRYANNCGAGNALSLYDPRTLEMAVHFVDGTGSEEFLETFAHEFVHAYMDLVYGATGPLWFAEGMAEYFSRIRWTSRGFKPTRKNWKAAMHMDVDSRIPLQVILKASREEIYGLKFYQYYAECWAIVHFLIHKHPEVIEGLLKREWIDVSLLADEYTAYVKKLMGA